jgi:hypothetical protein
MFIDRAIWTISSTRQELRGIIQKWNDILIWRNSEVVFVLVWSVFMPEYLFIFFNQK